MRGSGTILCNAGRGNAAGLLHGSWGTISVHKVGCLGFGSEGSRDVALG